MDKNMKVPGWAIAVGVIMMIFGGCGGLSNFQKINTPKALEQSTVYFEKITKEIEEAVQEERINQIEADSMLTDSLSNEISSDSENEGILEAKEAMSDLMHFSDYYKKWIVIIGIVGVLASLIYLIAGILLLMGKPIALKAAYGAIGVSFASVVFQIVVLALDKESGFIAGISSFGSYFMILVNIILLVIILASDKSYFQQNEIIRE